MSKKVTNISTKRKAKAAKAAKAKENPNKIFLGRMQGISIFARGADGKKIKSLIDHQQAQIKQMSPVHNMMRDIGMSLVNQGILEMQPGGMYSHEAAALLVDTFNAQKDDAIYNKLRRIVPILIEKGEIENNGEANLIAALEFLVDYYNNGGSDE